MPVTPFTVVHHRMRTLAIDYQSTPRQRDTQVGGKERVPRFNQQKRSTRRVDTPKIPSVEKTNQSEKQPSYGGSSSSGSGSSGGNYNEMDDPRVTALYEHCYQV